MTHLSSVSRRDDEGEAEIATGSANAVFSGEMTKARPPPMEEGLRLEMEKERNVERLAGTWLSVCRKVMGLE